MKKLMARALVFGAVFFAVVGYADTPPPGTVKAKTFSGDGATAITATGTSLNVNVTNSSGGSTVDQGAAGSQSWLMSVTDSALPANAAKETGGHLASIDTKLTAPLSTSRTWSLLNSTDSVNAVQSGSWSLTANIGTTGGLALDTSVLGLQVSQGSASSGQKGALAFGAVTTAAPPYTTAQSSPLSLTTGGSLRVDGSAVTQPVSAASLPLPSGASTAAKQPALGSAGSPSSDVLTVQGITSMTPLKVDASGTTVPVSVASLPALTAGSAIIGKVGIDQTTPGTTNGVQVNAALPAGGNSIGIVKAQPSTPAAVTVKQAAITVGTSAVRLTNDGSAPPSTRVLLVAQLLSSSTANCYFGASSVGSSGATRGVQMFAGQTFSFTSDAGDYYAICDTTSQTFLVTEQE